jgi:hypothetical protein
MRLLAFGFVAACGGGGTPPAAAPAETAQLKPECERMADHLVSLMAPSRGDLPAAEQPTELVDQITQTLIKRCVADAWSIDARTCFGTAASLEATDSCAPFLTVPQRDAMNADMAAALGEPS